MYPCLLSTGVSELWRSVYSGTIVGFDNIPRNDLRAGNVSIVFLVSHIGHYIDRGFLKKRGHHIAACLEELVNNNPSDLLRNGPNFFLQVPLWLTCVEQFLYKENILQRWFFSIKQCTRNKTWWEFSFIQCTLGKYSSASSSLQICKMWYHMAICNCLLLTFGHN